MTGDWLPEGVELALAFVRERTGVEGEVRLTRGGRRARAGSALLDQAWSGASPDPRDPARVDAVVAALVEQRGWAKEVTGHAVTARWVEVVGPDVAAHASVEGLEEGELRVRCDSTTWATQLRLLVPDLLARIAADVGPDVVRTVVVRGPDAPSWVRGPRRVRGRGPRDTYG